MAAPVGRAALHLGEPRRVRLLLEAADVAERVEAEDPHLRRVGRVHRLRRDGDVGLALDVRVDQLAEVHAVEVIAGEDQVVLRLVRREVARGLPHRVRRPLEPVGVVGRLLGGEHLDEAVGEEVQPVGLRDVAVERRRVELREHEDLLQPGVEAVADRDVDQPVLPADRHGRLRPHVRERVEPRPASAAEDERQHVVHGASSLTDA